MNWKILIAATLLSAGIIPTAAWAQAEAGTMADVVRQLRETAAQMESQLSSEEIEELLRSADELEREDARGSFSAGAPAASPVILAHLEQVHGATFEWLGRTTTCAGFQWENWRRYRITTGQWIAERNEGCSRAFALFERYFYAERDGNGSEALALLTEYDRAAHGMVDQYENR